MTQSKIKETIIVETSIKPKVSVIVPVYNSEKTLKRCADSILSQSYGNVEVILVNDGSKDGSLKVCEELKLANEKRVKVLNKENTGVSSARNAGINASNGELIQFLDADDYINPGMTQCLVDEMAKNNADVVVCGYNRVNGSNVIKKTPPRFCGQSLKEFKSCFEELYKGAFFNSPWNKLYRRDKITEPFDETCTLGEDLLFNLCYFSNCGKISVVKDGLYNYSVSAPGSLSDQYNDRLFDTEIMLHKKVQEFFKNSFSSEDFSGINEVFAKEIYYYLKKLVILSADDKGVKLRKIKDCLENDFVKNILYNVKLSDSQVKIVCELIKRKNEKAIYWFFKLKKLLNSGAVH